MNKRKQNELSLTIAYSTLADRAANIRLPEFRPEWEILIIVQSPDGAPVTGTPLRDDVRVVTLNSRGVAKSRNAAIEHARGDYIYFADDDIKIDPMGLELLVMHLDFCDCSLAVGQVTDEYGKLRKRYANKVQDLTLFNSAKVGTIEMMLRVSAAHNHGLAFDEDFGAGSLNYIGDEYIFVADLLRSGLHGHALPIPVASHPAESSGAGWGSDSDLRARARVFDRVFGATAPLMRAGFGLRHLPRIGSAARLYKFVQGYH